MPKKICIDRLLSRLLGSTFCVVAPVISVDGLREQHGTLSFGAFSTGMCQTLA